MAFLTKDQIIAVDDIPFEDVDVPEWKGTVRVRGLDAKNAQLYAKGMVTVNPLNGKVQKLNLDSPMTDLLAVTLVDESNNPLFEKKEIELLAKKSAAVMTRLFEVAQRLSGLNQNTTQEIKENLN